MQLMVLRMARRLKWSNNWLSLKQHHNETYAGTCEPLTSDPMQLSIAIGTLDPSS